MRASIRLPRRFPTFRYSRRDRLGRLCLRTEDTARRRRSETHRHLNRQQRTPRRRNTFPLKATPLPTQHRRTHLPHLCNLQRLHRHLLVFNHPFGTISTRSVDSHHRLPLHRSLKHHQHLFCHLSNPLMPLLRPYDRSKPASSHPPHSVSNSHKSCQEEEQHHQRHSFDHNRLVIIHHHNRSNNRLLPHLPCQFINLLNLRIRPSLSNRNNRSYRPTHSTHPCSPLLQLPPHLPTLPLLNLIPTSPLNILHHQPRPTLLNLLTRNNNNHNRQTRSLQTMFHRKRRATLGCSSSNSSRWRWGRTRSLCSRGMVRCRRSSNRGGVRSERVKRMVESQSVSYWIIERVD